MTAAIVLASSSAARARMLEAAGVAIQIDPARIDEAAAKAAFRAEQAPARDQADSLAELKALRISNRHPGRLVLGADQVLQMGEETLDKPADREAARDQLMRLRGVSHQLFSAAVIAVDGAPIWRHVGAVRLTMRPFSDAFLDQYLDQAGDAVLGSVGAYHLEGLGAQLFSRIDGDFFTVLGLPLIPVLGFLRARDVLIE